MTKSNISNKEILIFWFPLSLTWLMMAAEMPVLTALIARMAEPKFNLAAFGVAYSLALIIEAPVIMIMSASTALVKGKLSFLKLRKFTYLLNGIITLLMLILLVPPIFDFITIDLIGLPEKVSELTYISTLILLPWPGAIGYRRFYQGILIKNNLTHRVAYGTGIRVVVMLATAFILFLYWNVDGVVMGSAALTMGVLAEGIAIKLMAIEVTKQLKNNELDLPEEKVLSFRETYSFYFPLAMTSILSLGVHPMVTFFMGQSRLSIESLAVLPVINSLVFIFRSFGLSFQEVIIAKVGENLEGYKTIKRFSIIVGSSVVLALALISFTPLADIWFGDISGLTPMLTEFSISPLMIMTIIPGLTFLISFQRAMLVHFRNTSPITMGTASEVIGIIVVLFISVKYFDLVGAVAAALAFVVGRIAANIYLTFPLIKSLKQAKLKQ